MQNTTQPDEMGSLTAELFGFTIADEGPDPRNSPSKLWTSRDEVQADHNRHRRPPQAPDPVDIGDTVGRLLNVGTSRATRRNDPNPVPSSPMAPLVSALATIDMGTTADEMTPEMEKREKSAHTVRAKVILESIRFQITLCRTPVFERPSLAVLMDAEILIRNLSAQLKAVTRSTHTLDILRSAVSGELDELSDCVAEQRENLLELKDIPITFVSGAVYFATQLFMLLTC